MNAPSPFPTMPSERHAQALAAGRLDFQQCDCGNRWLPPREACPACLRTTWQWRTSCGRGRLVSWVVYRVAYDEAFRQKVPYNVAIVELEENIRVITNIVGHADGSGLTVDMPLELILEQEHGLPLVRFVPIV